MLRATNASVAAMAYVKDNLVVVKLTEHENDVLGAKLRSSTVEDHSVIIIEQRCTSTEKKNLIKVNCSDNYCPVGF